MKVSQYQARLLVIGVGFILPLLSFWCGHSTSDKRTVNADVNDGEI